MNMDCPKCQGKKAYIAQGEDSYAKVVRCPECGWWCWLKHYRAEAKPETPKNCIP